jgi:hypothetical protein
MKPEKAEVHYSRRMSTERALRALEDVRINILLGKTRCASCGGREKLIACGSADNIVARCPVCWANYTTDRRAAALKQNRHFGQRTTKR